MQYLSLFLILAVSTQAFAENTAQQIVDKAIEYHGGSRYTNSESSMVITSKSGSFKLVSKMDGGLYEHRVWRMRDGREELVRVTNDLAELTVDGVTTVAEGELAARLRTFVNERIYFPFLPYRLNDPGVIKTDLGTEAWDGRGLRKIKVTFEGVADDGDEYLYWFDPKTGRLEQFAYSFSNGRGGLRLRKAFDYRRVGGLLFYDSENLGLSGRDHRVDEITPQFVATNMSPISTIRLTQLKTKPLHR